MIDPIAVGLTKEYVLKNDTENPTIWIIGSLDSMTAAKIISGAGRVEIKDGVPVFVASGNLADNDFLLVKYGLKGWKNFKIDGQEAQFETTKEKMLDREIDVITDKTLSSIPLFAIHELAMEIWGSNNIDTGIRKN